MTAPIHLPIRDVALAAKKALDEGRLSAQGPTPACEYRDKSGRPCAIGAAISDEDVTYLEGELSTGIFDLYGEGLVTTDDLSQLCELQGSHDNWALRRSTKSDFRRTLNRILTRVA